MPWKDRLKQLKAEWNNLKSNGAPEHHNFPPSDPPQIYWRPPFGPERLVNTDWDLKTGNGPDGWGNQELQHYSNEAANSFYTQDEKLVVRAVAWHKSHRPEEKFTSARLVSKQTLQHDRGVLTGLIQSPCAPGIWPAFWLLPKEPFSWPQDGEIDISETWNGDCENKTCLHWGHHHDPQKHRTLATRIPDMAKRAVRYDFAWDQPGGQPGQGRMVWYIDGKAVMKGEIPQGTRPMRDFTILLNIAMGGNVCGGKVPADGRYDLIVHSLYLADSLERGGWARFDADYANAGVPIGNTY